MTTTKRDKSLVVIQLTGGNDYLNTVVPYSNGLYYDSRPAINIPADQVLRIDDHVGSIEVGKDADLVLYDGHPLEIRSVVQKTFVDGDLYFDVEADRERQSSIEGIKKKLNPEKEEDAESGDGDSAPSAAVVWQEAPYSCREDE